MESEGGREDTETLGNHAGRQSFRSSRDEQAEQVQPGFLAERSERLEREQETYGGRHGD